MATHEITVPLKSNHLIRLCNSKWLLDSNTTIKTINYLIKLIFIVQWTNSGKWRINKNLSGT